MPHHMIHELELAPVPAGRSSVASQYQDAHEVARDGRALDATPTGFESPIPARPYRHGVPHPLHYLRLSLDAELRVITSNCVSS